MYETKQISANNSKNERLFFFFIKHGAHMKTPFADYKFNHGSGWPLQLLLRDGLCHQTLASAELFYSLRRGSPPGLPRLQLILCSWAASARARWGHGPEEGKTEAWGGHAALELPHGEREVGGTGSREEICTLFLLVFSSSCSSDHSNR